ncbi:MAG: hypothetical protein ACLUVC_13210 [Longibaculum sp.]
MCNNISLNRKFIKDNYDDFLKENSIELEKKELLPFLYRIYKNV